MYLLSLYSQAQGTRHRTSEPKQTATDMLEIKMMTGIKTEHVFCDVLNLPHFLRKNIGKRNTLAINTSSKGKLRDSNLYSRVADVVDSGSQ